TSPLALERYEAEILRVKAVLKQLELDRAAVADYSCLCRCILSPVRRLPSEVLVEIFVLCVLRVYPLLGSFTDEPERSLAREMSRLAKSDLLQLSQVCPRWHRLVMGTPTFWATADLDLLFWDRSREPRMLDLLRSSLERGGGSLMDVRVRPPDEFRHHFGEPFVLLAQHSRRWRAASLSVDF
ncbi:hypothetical protein C8R44DRAFT_599599, partial [Mycena epipterygia]